MNSGTRKGNTTVCIQAIAIEAQEMAFHILPTYCCRCWPRLVLPNFRSED